MISPIVKDITVLPVLPSTIALKAAETVLPKNVPNFGLTMQVKDNEGKGLDDRSLIVVSNGAKLVKSPVSLGSGDYTVKLSPTSDSPIEVTTSIKGSASTNPPFGIGMRANNDRLINDGVSTSLLSFAVYDRFGTPIIGQLVEFELIGSGSLPTTAKTNAAGLAQVMYTAGTESGMVKSKPLQGVSAVSSSCLSPQKSCMKVARHQTFTKSVSSTPARPNVPIHQSHSFRT